MGKRRRYGDRLSKTVDAATGWSAWEWPVHEGYRLACCGCGLVHDVNFRIEPVKQWVGVQFRINRRATAAVRRGKRYAKVVKALRS